MEDWIDDPREKITGLRPSSKPGVSSTFFPYGYPRKIPKNPQSSKDDERSAGINVIRKHQKNTLASLPPPLPAENRKRKNDFVDDDAIHKVDEDEEVEWQEEEDEGRIKWLGKPSKPTRKRGTALQNSDNGKKSKGMSSKSRYSDVLDEADAKVGMKSNKTSPFNKKENVKNSNQENKRKGERTKRKKKAESESDDSDAMSDNGDASIESIDVANDFDNDNIVYKSDDEDEWIPRNYGSSRRMSTRAKQKEGGEVINLLGKCGNDIFLYT